MTATLAWSGSPGSPSSGCLALQSDLRATFDGASATVRAGGSSVHVPGGPGVLEEERCDVPRVEIDRLLLDSTAPSTTLRLWDGTADLTMTTTALAAPRSATLDGRLVPGADAHLAWSPLTDTLVPKIGVIALYPTSELRGSPIFTAPPRVLGGQIAFHVPADAPPGRGVLDLGDFTARPEVARCDAATCEADITFRTVLVNAIVGP